MKKVFCTSAVILTLLLPLSAGKKRETGLNPSLMKEIKASFKMTPQLKLAQNALTRIDVRKFAVDFSKIQKRDTHFSNKLKGQKITSQKSTGRCWMYAGLNVLRPIAKKRLKVKDIEFSQTYLFFYDKMEKANMFLEGIIKSKKKPLDDRYVMFLLKAPVQDGGQWVGMAELIKKYGVVPVDIMPDTYSSSHSSGVNRVLALKLKQYALKIRKAKKSSAIEKLKIAALKDVYKILAVNFGEPPQTFKWRYMSEKKLTTTKVYTPLEFYKDSIGEELDDYYALYSIPNRPYNRLYEIDLDKAVYDGPNMKFVNCPIEVLKKGSEKSILDNMPVWFGCDVGKDSLKEGLMVPDVYNYNSVYGMDFSLSRKEMFEVYSNNPTHAMVFTGVDIVNNKTRKWLVENSWGAKFGKKGYYHMRDKWFDIYVQVVVLHKKHIPEKVLKLYKSKSEVLPPWDPMYSQTRIEK